MFNEGEHQNEIQGVRIGGGFVTSDLRDVEKKAIANARS